MRRSTPGGWPSWPTAGISPSSLTRLVDRLEERGWVLRESPRENRRTTQVVITADGLRAYVRNNRPFVQAVDELIAARLSDGQMQELIGLLERIRI